MAVTLEILAFYEAIPSTSPATYTLQYQLLWDSTEPWTGGIVVLGWGPQGVFADDFSPSLSFSGSNESVTRTVTVSQVAANYVPLVQDASFADGSPWTLVNASVSGHAVVLLAGGTASQKITLQPGTYTFFANPTIGTITLTINGFAYTEGTSTFTVDDTPIELVISSVAGATLSVITITGTPVFPVIVPPTQQEFPQVPTSAAFPLYVVAANGNKIVKAAVYLTNVAPATGSPQALQSPVIVTPLNNTLTPIPAAALQPSSVLNN